MENRVDTIDEMIEAFEDRIDELEVDSCTDINSADQIDSMRYNTADLLPYSEFVDTDGIFTGERGAVVTTQELEDYFYNNPDDPVIESYEGDFDSWFRDTIEFMERI